MNKISVIYLIFQMISFASLSQVKVQNLLCENRTNPVGIDYPTPRLSWQLASDQRSILQTAYEIRVSKDKSSLTSGSDLTWSTGKVLSEQSVHVSYAGDALLSGEKYFWQVRVWDNKGNVSGWSDPAFWQMGLLNISDFTAAWIGPGYKEDSTLRPCPFFRKEFSLDKKIKSATLFITAHGLYEAFLNGQRVGDAYFTPGWTSYDHRLQYQTYDVTGMLKDGKNAAGVTLGDGWYRGYVGYSGEKNLYGDDVALLFQLDITYVDGTKSSIISDNQWKTSTEAIRSSDIQMGEIYDARLEQPGWNMPGYNDARWSWAVIHDYPRDILTASYSEPVRKHEKFSPVKILKTPKGENVIDFGQNLTGWVKFKVTGKEGDTVKLQHAEVLDKKGDFYTANLRAAKATDTYILKGGGEENFEPHFTYHGFRYVKVTGYPGPLKAENFTAVALYSDLKPTGTFSCSDEMVNKLQHNIQWSQKDNFLAIPTDCPQRDERLGWTGDAEVFSRTASFNMNVDNFFARWLKDLSADQANDGAVPFFIPNVNINNTRTIIGTAGWSDAATIIPWNMYMAYGDKKLLNDQYPSMKAWVNYMRSKSKDDLWNTGFQFGDWLSYRAEENDPFEAVSAITDKYFIAQCFYAHSTQLLINAAQVLGMTSDVKEYTDLLQKIKTAFMNEYVTPDGRLISQTQTAYALVLAYDMLPESMRSKVAERLVENIRHYHYHLTTGFLGTPLLCEVLSRFGHSDIAYELLLQDTYPSWLYPVKMGATTIWERWDGIKPDSTFEDPSMNSFNHYAYGAIGDWMYRYAAGIQTDENGPGYKQVVIEPHVSPKLFYVNADLDTYYGKVSSHWRIENGKLTLDVEIPANTSALIYIPSKDIPSITESGDPIYAVKDLQTQESIKDYVIVKAGSGKYHFVVTM